MAVPFWHPPRVPSVGPTEPPRPRQQRPRSTLRGSIAPDPLPYEPNQLPSESGSINTSTPSLELSEPSEIKEERRDSRQYGPFRPPGAVGTALSGGPEGTPQVSCSILRHCGIRNHLPNQDRSAALMKPRTMIEIMMLGARIRLSAQVSFNGLSFIGLYALLRTCYCTVML